MSGVSWLRRALCAALLLMLVWLGCGVDPARAEAEGLEVSGRIYKLEGKSKFEFTSTEATPERMTGAEAMGKFTLVGDVRLGRYEEGVPVYEVNGALGFRYAFDAAALEVEEDAWSVVSDDAREVSGVELDGKLGRGALILQASLDGEKWITECKLTDVLKPDSKIDQVFYNVNDLQLQNGCRFRVLLAYRERRKTGESNILFVKNDEYESRGLVELYEFRAISEELTNSASSAADTPRRELGHRIETKKGNGYSGRIDIKSDDPHYGWELGSFVVNGYTRETADEEGTPVFLKTPGDRVTLWFHLDEDIDRLNGDEALSIAADKDGSDNAFEIKKTNFGRGALLIRFTDHEHVVHEPVMYTNYLEAGTRTGADTRVQLFEEGDYEVALDYEIRKKGAVQSKYTDYRIYFKFKIRNGNCMVYPFDLTTGSEL